MGTPSAVKVGPGLLYYTFITTPEPVDLTTPWATVDPLWLPFGYTDDGSSFMFDQTFEDIEVAEEFEPIDSMQTKRVTKASFAVAEMTYANLVLALNGATVTASGSGANHIQTVVPPVVGNVTRIKLGWEAQDHKERWVFHECLQTGSVEIARKKAPNKATIPMEFQALIPAAGGQPWKAIFADPV